MARKQIKARRNEYITKGRASSLPDIAIHHFNSHVAPIFFQGRKQNQTHLGVEAVAKLGDAAGDLVEVDRLLAAVPLDDVHLAHGWKLLVPMQWK